MTSSAAQVKKKNRLNPPKAVMFRYALNAIKRPAMLVVIAFLLSFARLFYVPSPFACAMIAVTGAMGESPLFPFLGALCALGMRLIWGVSPEPWQAIGCLFLVLTRRFYHRRSDWVVGGWTALSLLPALIYALFFQSPAQQILAMASMVMGAVCVPAFYQSARLLKEPKEAWGWDDRLCMALVVGLLLCAMGYLHLFTINLGVFISCLLTLCLAYACSSGAGAVSGLMTGAVLALCGHGSPPMLMLCTAGLTAGLLTPLENRFKTALVFFLTAVLTALISSYANLLHLAIPSLAASLVFLTISSAKLQRLGAFVHQIQPQSSAQENTYAGEKLRQWESAIDEMAKSLPSIPEPKDPFPWQALRRCLCDGCEGVEHCWEGESHGQVFLQALWEAGQEGEEALKAYAASSLCECQRLHLVMPAISAVAEQMNASALRQNRARLEQEMIRTHLTAMAQAARRLSACAQGESLSDLKGAMEIQRVLKETSFPAHLLYVRRPGGHLQCVLESDTPAFTRWQPQRILSDLWAHGGLSMEITQLERGRMHLEETPVFRLQTGSATLAMEDANGDGILSMRFPGGRHVLALSDGMGHGPDAHQESRETLNLLRLCLAADYTRAQAITAVNGMMLSATGGDRFATVDLWTIDLWNGLVQVEKLGACQSCLWRNDKPRFIQGAALPLGILEKAEPQSCQFRLYDNDLILIFSDGIADAFENEEALACAISRCVYQDPQRTADALLRQALIAYGGTPRDDMTVLAARLTQWSAAASPIPFASSQ